MKNAGSLEEGKKVFEEVRHRIPPYSDDHAKPFTQVKHWKAESEAIKTVLDNGNASAQKMTTHGEVNDTDPAFPQDLHFFQADKVYAANIKRWETVDKAIKEWITKMEALVKMWEDQAGNYL